MLKNTSNFKLPSQFSEFKDKINTQFNLIFLNIKKIN